MKFTDKYSVIFFGVYRYRLRPRFLRDVSKVDTKVQLFGGEVAFPMCVSPTAMQCMAHPDGEAATARGSSPLLLAVQRHHIP